jgi:hypothetical protein
MKIRKFLGLTALILSVSGCDSRFELPNGERLPSGCTASKFKDCPDLLVLKNSEGKDYAFYCEKHGVTDIVNCCGSGLPVNYTLGQTTSHKYGKLVFHMKDDKVSYLEAYPLSNNGPPAVGSPDNIDYGAHASKLWVLVSGKKVGYIQFRDSYREKASTEDNPELFKNYMNMAGPDVFREFISIKSKD